jgi:RecA/RadA recombinase
MKLQEIVADKKKNRTYCSNNDLGTNFYRLPAGIFPYDLAMAGGIPIGVPVCFYGHPSSGKTLLASKAIATSQKICWNCFEYLDYCTCGQKLQKYPVIIDNEGYDTEWAEYNGVDLDNLYVFKSDIGEEAVDTVYEALQADDVGLVVLDSISNVIPEAEITESAMKNHMGKSAKLQSTLTRKVQSALVEQKRKGQRVGFLSIAQVAANIGDLWGPSEVIKAGWVARHSFHVTCRLSQLKTKPEYVDKETELPIFGRFKSSTIASGNKRKVFTLSGTSEFYVCLKNTGESRIGDVLDHKTLYKYADQVGLIDKNRWSSTFDELKFGSKNEMMQYWKENPEYLLQLKKNVVQYYCDAERGVINGNTDDVSEVQQADDAQ